MIIKLRANPTFCGELYKTQFVEGVSQEHVNKHTFDMIRDTLGLEPYVIEPDEECTKCKQKDEIIKDLEATINSLTLKLKKKAKE
jgi:hypothetical protein